MYSQSKKQSATEKKLQALRAQLYGKPESQKVSRENTSSPPETSPRSGSTFSFSSPINNSAHAKADDDSFLKHDLARTLIFASFAIGAQIILKFVVRGS